MAVLRAVMHFQESLKGLSLLVRSDNLVTVSYINHQGGIRSQSLNSVARDLFQWAELSLISLRAVHIKGVDNVVADSLSRFFPSFQEMQLTRVIFQAICRRFGRPWVDLFASPHNAQLRRFCARTSHPGAWGVDALSIQWPCRLLYAFPPVPLIPRLLSRLLVEDRLMIVVVPFWPRRSWFPLLRALAVQDPWILPRFPSPIQSPMVLPSRGILLSVWKLKGGGGRVEV